MRITRGQLRRIISEEARRLHEGAQGPKVEAMRAFAERFGYDFLTDPEDGRPYVSAAPFEGEEVVYLNDDDELVFAFADGSAPITLEELEEWTRTGKHPSLELDDEDDY